MEIEFKPGDRIRIVRGGCNNSSVKEFESGNTLGASTTIYTINDVKTSGKYLSHSGTMYTLILNTGHPIWNNHCELVKEEIINNYSIY